MKQRMIVMAIGGEEVWRGGSHRSACGGVLVSVSLFLDDKFDEYVEIDVGTRYIRKLCKVAV